jgi:hypothetical protein
MRNLFGYPDAWGAKRVAVFPHAGPASYTQVTVGSPSLSPASGGDEVEAASCGMKTFDVVIGGVTDDGLYRVAAIPQSLSSNPNGAPQEAYTLMWTVISTGAEVAGAVDLSDSVVRLLAVGPN